MSKRYRAAILPLGLAVVVLGVLIWLRRDDLALLGDLKVSWPLMLGAISLTVVGSFLSFVRWYWLVIAQGLPFRLSDAFRLGLVGAFFNFVVPGAVGGDLVKAALIAREQEKRVLAVSTIVVDRVVGLLGLLVLTGMVAIVMWDLSIWPEPPPLSSYLIAIPFGLLSTGIPVTPGGWASRRSPSRHSLPMSETRPPTLFC